MPWDLAVFFLYLTMFQKPLKILGIEKAIRDGTAERGLVLGSTTRDAFVVLWVCVVLHGQPIGRGVVLAGGMCMPSSGGQLGGRHDGDEVSTTEDERRTRRASPRRRRRGLLDATDQTEASRLLAAVYFGSFHGVVGYVVAGFRYPRWSSSPHWCSRVDVGRG